MIIAGYIAALFIGIILGLIGGGGSILTVPLLVYLFGISPALAISYSLFIVGFTSMIGAINNYRHGYIDIKAALLFGISSVITVFIIRKFVLPLIPGTVQLGQYSVSTGVITMIVFAILMLLASLSMIKGRKQNTTSENTQSHFLMLLLYGVGIGVITGFLGAGGGFILIPALVLLLNLPMKTAVGTSLMIIAMNSIIGFTGDIGHYEIDWNFVITISILAIVGVIAGGLLAKQIAGARLKKAFGWFVLIMGFVIILKEVFT